MPRHVEGAEHETEELAGRQGVPGGRGRPLESAQRGAHEPEGVGSAQGQGWVARE